MRLIIVSGLSGSGKSVALDSLEDLGFYCIDNVPANLLGGVINQIIEARDTLYDNIAVGVDARNRAADLESLPALLVNLQDQGVQCEIMFLHAEDQVLLQRYRETRRRHPLRTQTMSLQDAISEERDLLGPIIHAADLIIDTTQTSIHDLKAALRERVGRSRSTLSIQIESFGFKHSVPYDADFVFDVRCLPNPYWDPELRGQNGRDPAVIEFLGNSATTATMLRDILGFLRNRIPEYSQNNRNYLTVAIGCTGGQHRSVYIADQLAAALREEHEGVLIRHNQLKVANTDSE